MMLRCGESWEMVLEDWCRMAQWSFDRNELAELVAQEDISEKTLSRVGDRTSQQTGEKIAEEGGEGGFTGDGDEV
jgi:hypothetical protein